MKGRHISRKTQRRLTRPPRSSYDELTIRELMHLCDTGDELAKRVLRRRCGFAP